MAAKIVGPIDARTMELAPDIPVSYHNASHRFVKDALVSVCRERLHLNLPEVNWTMMPHDLFEMRVSGSEDPVTAADLLGVEFFATIVPYGIIAGAEISPREKERVGASDVVGRVYANKELDFEMPDCGNYVAKARPIATTIFNSMFAFCKANKLTQ